MRSAVEGECDDTGTGHGQYAGQTATSSRSARCQLSGSYRNSHGTSTRVLHCDLKAKEARGIAEGKRTGIDYKYVKRSIPNKQIN